VGLGLVLLGIQGSAGLVVDLDFDRRRRVADLACSESCCFCCDLEQVDLEEALDPEQCWAGAR
jgi:hypothetical protein